MKNKKEKKPGRFLKWFSEKMSGQTKKRLRIIFRNVVIIGTLLCFLGLTAALTVSAAMVERTDGRILPMDDTALLYDVDCILILGCGVRDDGTPSPQHFFPAPG